MFALSRQATAGWVRLGHLLMPCALGRSGRGYLKREGDGVTPIGRWPVRQVLFRADKRGPLLRPPCRDATALRAEDGWCDAVGDVNYNRAVRHPYPASAERLWRDDRLYDIIVVLGHNDRPRVQGAGSAIFMHIADQDEGGGLKPTAGCVALKRRDLQRVLAQLGRVTHVRVTG